MVSSRTDFDELTTVLETVRKIELEEPRNRSRARWLQTLHSDKGLSTILIVAELLQESLLNGDE